MTGHKVFIDSNLSILLIAGLCGPSYVARHRRLQGFQYEDFELLRTLLTPGEELVFSPNVLTETSNLLRQIGEPSRGRLSAQLAEIVGPALEVYIESRSVVSSLNYLRLGLTDVALLECLSRQGGRLLTTDVNLYVAALALGYVTENFNHHRDSRLS